ncbi:MAG: uracil-DNA glycosylase [Verrucomicrobia bacterium]|nr:uracil-DNA glycosylase [Verrucomicrobiota bacterium]
MSDSFQEAIHASLPLLKKIQKSIKPLPGASGAALAKLRETAANRRAPAPKPAAAPAQRVESESPQPAKKWTFESLRGAVLACEKCPHLVRSRTQVVFGVGNPNAELMFVGEAPGADEDEQGEPFVGRAGQLLTKMIQAMGFERSDIFIANVLKCRPDMPDGESGNRKPKPAEMGTCLPWLREQIDLIQPRAIVALGATAVEGLLGDTSPMRDLRGRWLEFQGIPVMVTYHPAYLLRNQTITEKRKVWEDMLLVLEKLGKKISAKQRAFFTKAAD